MTNRKIDRIEIGLIAASLVTALIATVALWIGIVSLGDQIGNIQKARQLAGEDSCLQLRKVVILAAKTGHHDNTNSFLTSKFMQENGLNNCRRYGVKVRRGQTVATP